MDTDKQPETPAESIAPGKRKRRTAKRKGPGRPPKLTLETVQEIGRLIAMGLTEEQACLHKRVNHETFRAAKKRNCAFLSAVQFAHADFLAEAVTKIYSGAPGWQGAAWIAERRHKPQFNRMEPRINTDNSQNTIVEIVSDGVSYTGTREEFFTMVQKAAHEKYVKPHLEKLTSQTP